MHEIDRTSVQARSLIDNGVGGVHPSSFLRMAATARIVESPDTVVTNVQAIAAPVEPCDFMHNSTGETTVVHSNTSKLLAIPSMAILDGGVELRHTCTEFRLTVNDLVNPTLEMMNIEPVQIFSTEDLATQIVCKRGCKEFPHSLELAVWGTVLGKWSGENASKNAARLINEAVETSKKCDGPNCKENPTGKHMLCKIKFRIIKTIHGGNGLVTHFFQSDFLYPF